MKFESESQFIAVLQIRVVVVLLSDKVTLLKNVAYAVCAIAFI